MHDNSELKSIIFISKIKIISNKKSLFYKKNIIWILAFSCGVKVVPFPEGINQLFVLYPVFLWKAQSDIPGILNLDWRDITAI